MENRFILLIGDWSGDGHEQSDKYVYSSNKTVFELQEAYKQSCYLTDLQFNCNNRFTKTEYEGYKQARNFELICDYEQSTVNKDQYEKLLSFGIDLKEYSSEEEDDEDDEKRYCWLDVDKFPLLILDFIKLSLPDFEYEEAAFKKSELNTIPALNTQDNLNVQFGYGLYY